MIFHYFNRRIRNFNFINRKVKQDDKEENHISNDSRKIIILPYIKHITEIKD